MDVYWICKQCDSTNSYEEPAVCGICGEKIDRRSEEKCIYEKTGFLSEKAANSRDFFALCEYYAKIIDYKDVRKKYSDCKFKAEQLALCEKIYEEAKAHFKRASEYCVAEKWPEAIGEFAAAEKKFKKNVNYLDSEECAKTCRREAELCSCKEIYFNAKKILFSATGIEEYKKAAGLFSSILGFSDAKQNHDLCLEFINQIAARQALEAAEKKYREAGTMNDHAARAQHLGEILSECCTYSQNPEFSELLKKCAKDQAEAKKHADYHSAVSMMSSAVTSAHFRNAADIFSKLGEFLDSAAKMAECKEKAQGLLNQETYKHAQEIYEKGRKINIFNWRKYR